MDTWIRNYYIEREGSTPTRIQPPRKASADAGVSRYPGCTALPTNPFNLLAKRRGTRPPLTEYTAETIPYIFFFTVGRMSTTILIHPTVSYKRTLSVYEIPAQQYAMIHGIPILGVVTLLFTDGVAHDIAFMFRGDTMYLFETYDSTLLDEYKDSKWWTEKIMSSFLDPLVQPLPAGERPFITEDQQKELSGRAFKLVRVGKFLFETDLNLQEDDPPESGGLCVMWSYVFLGYLRDLDLRRATLDDMERVYTKILEEAKTEEGKAKMRGMLWGSGRKTRTNKKRGSYNVVRTKSRKGVSRGRRHHRA